MLVGLGIGATPMISIMKDMVHNIKAVGEEEEEDALENGMNGRSGPQSLKGTCRAEAVPKRKAAAGSTINNFQTRKTYFYWVTREQGSFEWFRGEMNEVAELDSRGVIDLNTYCTSVYEEGDARSALIAMLQSLNHAKNGIDIVSGTRVKSHFAKPNWHSVYERIASNHTHARVGQSPAPLPSSKLISFLCCFMLALTYSTSFYLHVDSTSISFFLSLSLSLQ